MVGFVNVERKGNNMYFIEIETVTDSGEYTTQYPIDTPEEIKEAQAALRTAGLDEAPVYRLDGLDGDETVRTWWSLPA